MEKTHSVAYYNEVLDNTNTLKEYSNLSNRVANVVKDVFLSKLLDMDAEEDRYGRFIHRGLFGIPLRRITNVTNHSQEYRVGNRRGYVTQKTCNLLDFIVKDAIIRLVTCLRI